MYDAIVTEKGYDAKGHTFTDEEKKEVAVECRSRFLGVLMFNNADPVRHGELQELAKNNFVLGKNDYPVSMIDAYEKLVYYVGKKEHVKAHHNDGVSYNNVGDGNSQVHANASNKERITCFNCGKKGHYASECTEEKKDEGGSDESATKSGGDAAAAAKSGGDDKKGTGRSSSAFIPVQEYHFHNDAAHSMPNTWILLDNQSTLDVFSNGELLENIRESIGSMTIH